MCVQKTTNCHILSGNGKDNSEVFLGIGVFIGMCVCVCVRLFFVNRE